MKKLVSLLLAVCTCLSISATLTACDEEHSHTYKTEWAKDTTHHWHECEGEDCTEVSDKAEHLYGNWSSVDASQHKKTCECGAEIVENHAWNDGEITTQPSASADGVKTFTCSACGQTKTEPVEYVPTETEIWQNAFDNDLLTNYTIRFVNDTETNIYKCSFTDGNHIVYVNGEGMEAYLVKTADNKYITYQKNNNIWTKSEMNENEISADFKDVLDNWYLSYTMMCPNFSNTYESFEYDSSEQIYKFEGVEDSYEIQTNSIMEYMSAKYHYATVELVDGKINHICVKMSGQSGEVYNFYFENYGTTTIELPTVTE